MAEELKIRYGWIVYIIPEQSEKTGNKISYLGVRAASSKSAFYSRYLL
ncbi:hypothetical protein KEH51_12645 [[Brevibacterium] frigoritolerans]|uniref:Uncharacterized protein n=1 Tax=Peribacillus frigoritolerans TaxID=450367 RepID=A0A941FRQ5_9BACI|nr:hypothetical protein [Peribacillus frigoritolerans]